MELINPFAKPVILPPLTDEEAKAVLDMAQNSVRTALLLGFNTGISLDDILGLRWTDVNFKDRILVVQRKDSQRIVVVPTNTMKVLDEHYKLKKNNALLVFGFGKHEFINRVKEAGRMARLELTWQRVRSTYAANAARAGIPILTAAKSMGTSPNAIVQYWRLNLERERDILNEDLV